MRFTGFSEQVSNYPDVALSSGELALERSPYAIISNFAPFLSSAMFSPGRIASLHVLFGGSTDHDDFSSIYKQPLVTVSDAVVNIQLNLLSVNLKPVLDLFSNVVLDRGSLIFLNPPVHAHAQHPRLAIPYGVVPSGGMTTDAPLMSLDSATQASLPGWSRQRAVRYTNIDVEMEIST